MDKTEFSCFMESHNQQLLTTRQAGKYLGVGEDKIREFSRNRYYPLKTVQLPNFQYPLYRIKDLDEYVEAFVTSVGDAK